MTALAGRFSGRLGSAGGRLGRLFARRRPWLPGISAILVKDLRGRMRWMGLYTQR